MVFLLDLTVPDGSIVRPGEKIEKVWQVRNEGSCTWGRGYTIQLEEGPPLGSLTKHPIPATEPGEVANISANFSVPDNPGNYRSSWRANDSGDNSFGVLIYIEINVSDN
jgi:rRNA maturation protein Nop10